MLSVLWPCVITMQQALLGLDIGLDRASNSHVLTIVDMLVMQVIHALLGRRLMQSRLICELGSAAAD